MTRSVPFARWLPVPVSPYIVNGHELTEPERLVLAVYVDRWRRGADRIDLSVSALQALTSLSERTVSAARARLENVGALEVVHTGGKGRGDTRQHRVTAAVLNEKGASPTGFPESERGQRLRASHRRKGPRKPARKGAETRLSLEERETPGALPRAAPPESTWPEIKLPRRAAPEVEPPGEAMHAESTWPEIKLPADRSGGHDRAGEATVTGAGDLASAEESVSWQHGIGLLLQAVAAAYSTKVEEA